MCKNVYSASDVLNIRRLDTLKILVYRTWESWDENQKIYLLEITLFKKSDLKFYFLNNINSETLSIAKKTKTEFGLEITIPPDTINNSDFFPYDTSNVQAKPSLTVVFSSFIQAPAFHCSSSSSLVFYLSFSSYHLRQPLPLQQMHFF